VDDRVCYVIPTDEFKPDDHKPAEEGLLVDEMREVMKQTNLHWAHFPPISGFLLFSRHD
jgi:hypothetical protein